MSITKIWRWKRISVYDFLLAILWLGIMPSSAHAQIYVSQFGLGPDAGIVGEYDGTTGAAINANFVTGLYGPVGLALSGDILFVAQFGGITVGKYNATTGRAINRNFIAGLNQYGGFGLGGLALTGNVLFVTNNGAGTVGEYNAATGEAINANLITGLHSPNGLVVAPNLLNPKPKVSGR